jgi:hypothetical protein
MNYLWSVVTSSPDAVLRRRLLSPQTQLDARDRIPNQLIASQSFLGVAGWGWGANVLSYSPNLAHCAVQTSSMQHRGFTTRWSEARRLAPRTHVTPKREGANWIRTFRYCPNADHGIRYGTHIITSYLFVVYLSLLESARVESRLP